MEPAVRQNVACIQIISRDKLKLTESRVHLSRNKNILTQNMRFSSRTWSRNIATVIHTGAAIHAFLIEA